MIFFYCQSYQAFNRALHINVSDEVTIITPADNVVKACEFLGVKYIYHKSFSTRDIIFQRKKILKELDSITRLLKHDEVHFSHTQIALFCFLLMKKVKACRNKVIFHDFEVVYKKIPFYNINGNLLKKKIQAFLIRILYGLTVEVREANKNMYVISFNMNYIYRSFNVINEKETYFELTLDLFKKIDIQHPPIRNLFIAQTFTNSKTFSLDKIKRVLPVLNQEDVFVKMHPKIGHADGLENCTVVPNFLPVEFYFNKVKNCIISFQSASLITASRFDGVKAISLLDLVKVDDPFNDMVKKDLSEKSNHKILFPKDINEFIRLLTDQNEA